MSLDQRPQVVATKNVLTTFRSAIEVEPNSNVAELLADLSPDKPWDDRQIATRNFGYMRNSESLVTLLAALPADPCCIFQLEFSLTSLANSPFSMQRINSAKHPVATGKRKHCRFCWQFGQI